MTVIPCLTLLKDSKNCDVNQTNNYFHIITIICLNIYSFKYSYPTPIICRQFKEVAPDRFLSKGQIELSDIQTEYKQMTYAKLNY